VDASDPDAGDVVNAFLDLGDGAIARAPTLHSYRTPGNYTVTLKAVDAADAATTATTTVLVEPDTAAPEFEVPVVAARVAHLSGRIPVTATIEGSAADAQGNNLSSLVVAFGDGSHAVFTGPGSITHVYVRPGLHTVVVSATDVQGRSGSAIAVVAVPRPGSASPPDSTLTVSRVIGSLRFKTSGRDRFRFRGVLRLAEGFRPEGRELRVSLGGLDETFVLDGRGRAKLANGSCASVRYKKPRDRVGAPSGTPANITVNLRGDLRSGLARIGATDRATRNEDLVDVPFVLLLEGTPYSGEATLQYSASKGRAGRLRFRTR
jgi:PKD repeat protein